MPFTEEQLAEFMLDLRPAMQAAGLSDSDFARVRDQLARPQPEFREGEVFWSAATFIYKQWSSLNKHPAPGDRKLQLSEMPEAVERIYKALKDWDNNYKTSSFADYEEMHEALADFDREIEP